MKRFILLLLSLVMIISAFSFSANAEMPISRVRDVTNKLNTYCIKEYFGGSKEWDHFKSTVQNASSYVSSGSHSDKSNQEVYDQLKEVYTALMFDVFDYSLLTESCSLFFKLDKTLFTEESFKEYEKSALDVYNEIISPSLYGTYSVVSREKYISNAQQKVDEFGNDLVEKFNALEIVVPENFTVSQISSIVSIAEVYFNEDYYYGVESWERFSSARDEAYSIIAESEPKSTDLNRIGANLINSYIDVFKETADFSPFEKVFEDYSKIDSKDYLPIPYAKYESNVKRLVQIESVPILFGFDKRKIGNNFVDVLNKYIYSIASKTDKLKNELTSLRDYNTLQSYVSYYKGKTYTEEARIYGEKLAEEIENGEKVLMESSAGHSVFNDASERIKNAGETLQLAENSIIEKNTSIFSSDMYMTRLLIYSIIAAFLISFIYSRILCRIFYGKINWRK